PVPLIQLYEVLRAKGEAGVIFMALPTVVIGSFLGAFHNVWSGIPIVLTMYGWAHVLKGTIYLLFPSFGLRQFARVTPERTKLFRLPGIPLLAMSAALAWHVIRASQE